MYLPPTVLIDLSGPRSHQFLQFCDDHFSLRPLDSRRPKRLGPFLTHGILYALVHHLSHHLTILDLLECTTARKIHSSVHHYVLWSLPVTVLQSRAFHLTLTSTSTASRFGFLSYSVASHTSSLLRWMLRSFIRPFFPNIRYP